MRTVLCRLAFLFLVLAGSIHVGRAEILQLRFNWAPIFCFAGSNNGVPKEFCGQGADGTPRLQRHRLSLLKPLNSGQCSDVPAYDASALSAEVRQHLACTNPSYVRLSNPCSRVGPARAWSHSLPASLAASLTRCQPHSVRSSARPSDTPPPTLTAGMLETGRPVWDARLRNLA